MRGDLFAVENIGMRIIKTELPACLSLRLRMLLAGKRNDTIAVFTQLDSAGILVRIDQLMMQKVRQGVSIQIADESVFRV